MRGYVSVNLIKKSIEAWDDLKSRSKDWDNFEERHRRIATRTLANILVWGTEGEERDEMIEWLKEHGHDE